MIHEHIIVKLREGAPTPTAPHWASIIEDKAEATAVAPASVARVLARWMLPVWVTREHRPAGAQWSPSEIASGLNRIYRLVMQGTGRIPPGAIDDIALLPEVEYARIGTVGRIELPPARATAMGVSTGLRSREAIRLEDAHRWTQGHPSITIAVLDTGVDVQHPEYRDAVVEGRDFVDILEGLEDFVGDVQGVDDDPRDEVGHGTHVAGIIAGAGRRMPIGVAPRCRILPVRVLAAMKQGDRLVGAGLIDNINVAIKWAVDQGADVINMSLGVRHTNGGLPHEEVIAYALRKGVTVVAAAGNDGAERLYYPGALPGVIAVGATDDDGAIAPYSTYGAQVSFVAPGTDVFSTAPGAGYAFSTGTSHATPFVTGAVALLKSYAKATKGARLADRQVKHILKHTADKVDSRFKHRKAGFGMLNLADAMSLLRYKLAS